LRLGSSQDLPEQRRLSLSGEEGDSLAFLAWDNANYGKRYLARLLPGVALIFVLMAILSWRLLSREHQNRQRYAEQLRKMASKDFLTGVSNRREFCYLANRELTRSQREKRPLAVLMIDIDHFKRVNDSWGHEAGDRVLAEFTSVVEQNLRDFDVLARLGGEEFAALLVSADLQYAQVVAERVRRVVADHPFDASTERALSCTVSIGLAAWDGEESLDALLSRVDKALYVAKHTGRNQVTLAQSAD
jgi:diguanylate cyclase (GGDEF)-like protein